jgi:predicted N-acyltransferase
MQLKIYQSLAEIPASQWDQLVADESPFLEHGWLSSLEEAGCVSAATGWVPQHLTLWEGDRLAGACPLYVKAHSQGEFVFDHSWADAAERGGLRYYPKLLVAVPFTPATGARFLAAAGVNPTDIAGTLGEVLKDLCARNNLSSVHVNFCRPLEVEVLRGMGFARRAGFQFQWVNQGWRTFDDYLAAFRSKRRGQIKRERRELEVQGIEITAHAGEMIDDDLFEPIFRLYKSTIDKLYWGRQYLNFELFDLLRRRWKHRLCFFVARQQGEIIAGAFTVRKGNTLYGRYWGTFHELRYLHFNVCYYATIEHCLLTGIERFEPGAGGEFKYLRGFDARPTESMHFVAHPALAKAVERFLQEERRVVAQELNWLDDHSQLRKS